jgi:hypothetical protein
MALHFLSGDDAEMGGKKNKAAKQQKKAAKKATHAAKKATKKATKAAKKAAKPHKTKKVAKVALAPARNAALAVIELNGLKLATKLVRVWNKPGGKDALLKKWQNLGGNGDKLKKAIIKGSKQSISGDSMGIVLASALALAAPVIIILAAIIKAFKGGGDAAEASDFDKGVNGAVQDLSNDPSITKEDQTMPTDGVVALVKSLGGGGGGTGGGGGGGGTGGGGGGGSSDDEGGGGGGEGDTEEDKANPAGSPLKEDQARAANPGTICLFLPILIAYMHLTNSIAYITGSLITLYCLIGIFVIPFYIGLLGERLQKVTRPYFDSPARWFYQGINYVKSFIYKFHY